MIKIRITLESKEDVIREILVNPENNLEYLHQFIINNLKLEKFEMASFYITDSNLDLGQEIPLFDTSEKDGDVITMKNMPISSVLYSKDSKLIYIYDFMNDTLINLTDDQFSESDPSWSIDGEHLFFISNRDKYTFTGSNLKVNNLPNSFNFSKNDIYKINIQNRKVIQITDTDWDESYPYELKDDKGVIYLSNQSGINNIYIG